MGPCVDRIHLLSGQRCFAKSPTQGCEGFIGPVDADDDVASVGIHHIIRLQDGVAHLVTSLVVAISQAYPFLCVHSAIYAPAE